MASLRSTITRPSPIWRPSGPIATHVIAMLLILIDSTAPVPAWSTAAADHRSGTPAVVAPRSRTARRTLRSVQCRPTGTPATCHRAKRPGRLSRAPEVTRASLSAEPSDLHAKDVTEVGDENVLVVRRERLVSSRYRCHSAVAFRARRLNARDVELRFASSRRQMRQPGAVMAPRRAFIGPRLREQPKCLAPQFEEPRPHVGAVRRQRQVVARRGHAHEAVGAGLEHRRLAPSTVEEHDLAPILLRPALQIDQSPVVGDGVRRQTVGRFGDDVIDDGNRTPANLPAIGVDLDGMECTGSAEQQVSGGRHPGLIPPLSRTFWTPL